MFEITFGLTHLSENGSEDWNIYEYSPLLLSLLRVSSTVPNDSIGYINFLPRLNGLQDCNEGKCRGL